MPSSEKRAAGPPAYAEKSPYPMMVVEECGKLVAMNASARQMLGYSKKEIGKLDLAALGAEAIITRQTTYRASGQIRAGGMLVRKDGNPLAVVLLASATKGGVYQVVLEAPGTRTAQQERLFESVPVPLIELDLDSPSVAVIAVNRQARAEFPDPGRADCVGMSLAELLGLTGEEAVSLGKWARGGNTPRTVKTGRGPERYFKLQLSPVGRGNDSVVRTLLALTDITDETRARQQFEAAVTEKTLLLREAQHRIKNNLELLISMLTLQRESLGDENCAKELLEIQSRIQAIALFHDRLANTDTRNSSVELGSFLKEIVRAFESTYLSGNTPITIETTLVPLELDGKRAATIGLIVNELLTNALKYAFRERPSGMILIQTQITAEYFWLTVSDNGQGLPAGFDWRRNGGLGFTFIDMLTQQLAATTSVQGEGGVHFSMDMHM